MNKTAIFKPIKLRNPATCRYADRTLQGEPTVWPADRATDQVRAYRPTQRRKGARPKAAKQPMLDQTLGLRSLQLLPI
jgi:hypothetical protein